MLIASLPLFSQGRTNAYFRIGLSAIDQIFRVMNEQSQPLFDADFNLISYYNWTGLPGSLAGSVNNGGNGEPKGYTGMVGTSHRPSDDLSVYGESTTTMVLRPPDRACQLSLRRQMPCSVLN